MVCQWYARVGSRSVHEKKHVIGCVLRHINLGSVCNSWFGRHDGGVEGATWIWGDGHTLRAWLFNRYFGGFDSNNHEPVLGGNGPPEACAWLIFNQLSSFMTLRAKDPRSGGAGWIKPPLGQLSRLRSFSVWSGCPKDWAISRNFWEIHKFEVNFAQKRNLKKWYTKSCGFTFG